MNIIESYSFGNITINSKSFTRDLIIFPENIVQNWWRKEGHKLHLEDLQEVLKKQPDVLVIGIGHDGVMKVPENLIAQLKGKKMEIVIKKSTEAVEEYNDRARNGEKVAAALHLTC